MNWIALVLSLIGIIANANRLIWCWPVWMTSDVFWTIHCYRKRDVPAVILWVVFFVFNVYGWWQWSR